MSKITLVLIAVVLVSGCFTTVSNGALVAHYQFNGDATDSAGNNDGVLHNSAAIVTCEKGGALSLDGVNDYMSVAPSSSLNFSQSYTISAWLKPVSDPGDDMVWFGYHSSAPNNSIHIRAYRYGLIRFATYGPKVDTAAGVFQFGQWNHVTATYNAASGYSAIYYNGELAQSGYMPAYGGGLVTATIGKWDVTFQSQNLFQGLINDFRIYNNALSASEVAMLVPEPMSLVLFGIGLAGVRRMKK